LNPEDTVNVSELAQRCAREMARYQRRERHDPRCCYELFRHALAHRNEEAWTAIYAQYCRLVSHWLGHAADDPGVLVNQVFERFWRALSPDRFAKFPSLDALLAYLKRCAQCVAIDNARQQEQKRAKEAALLQIETLRKPETSSDSVLDVIASEQLFEHAAKCLNDSRESLAFRASFEWGLRPSEIADRWANVFASAQEVSRVKERVLRRLRRDEELIEMFGITASDGVESA
jgi:DNA-directed RNA polymerase specialized sigma24 family protein